MEHVLSTIAPLAVVGAAVVASGMYYNGSCSRNNNGKKAKPTKQPSSSTTSNDDNNEDDIEDLYKKKSKPAPTAAKINFQLPKQKGPQSPQGDKPQQPPQPKKEKVVAEVKKDEKVGKRDEKKAAAVPEVKKEEPKKTEVKKEAPKKQLSEVELLKQRIAELEGKKDEPQLSKKQQKKAAATEEKKDDKKAAYNPAPQLTEVQKKEQEQALIQFERDNQWREIPLDNKGKKDKKKADTHEYVDLSVFTISSSMTTVMSNRRVIVGENAATLKEICSISGCKIEVQPRPSKEVMATATNGGADMPLKIDFEGTQEQIAEARKIIQELITKGYSNVITPDKTEAKLRVEASDRFQIIGKDGCNIKKITAATGVKIELPPKPKEGTSDSDDIIHIVGTTEGVAAAKDAIRSLVKDGYSDLTHDNWSKLVVDFPATYRRYLLISFNQDRALIRTIEDRSGCKLVFPQGQTDNTINIVGPSDSVYQAAADVSAVIKKLDQPVNDVYLAGFDGKPTDFKSNELW